MDLYCKRCGEPFDFFLVQEEMQATERRRFYDGKGCPACYGKEVKLRPASPCLNRRRQHGGGQATDAPHVQ